MTTTHATTTDETEVDEAKVEAFVGQVLGDLAGLMNARLATIGDRLGLWKELATNGPATSEDFAARAGIAERYAREWLAGMHAAAYLDYEPTTDTYSLPAHAVPVFAQEGGPLFFGGSLQMVQGTATVFEELCDAFRNGGGIPQSGFGHDVYEGIQRFTSGWFEHELVPEWLPLLPDVTAKLEAGCDVADVGTGAGKALIALATQYPNGRYVGYDVFEPQAELARRNLAAAGLSDRVRIEVVDPDADLPDTFDVITTFDVIHDAVDPAGLLARIRRALRPGGRYVCLDVNASHKVEENVGPLASLFYGMSIHYCMTTSLAHGGTGLGTCGFNPHVAERMCADAGFATFRRVEMENPFNTLYEATA
jgi:SAM-dependent methyltransferase